MRGGVYVVGDLHGDWGALNKFLTKKEPELVLVCGDFGYWPKQSGTNILGKIYYDRDGRQRQRIWHQCGIKNKNTKIHWCDGNHEDHWALESRPSDEICSGVFYQPRGSTLTLPDGQVVLFMGGAESVDKGTRTLGLDWFPEETIAYRNFQDLPDIRIDIVVSHTCPKEFIPYMGYSSKYNDPSCEALSRILEIYRPRRWFFGHWHQYKKDFVNDCAFMALNMIGETGWWFKLI